MSVIHRLVCLAALSALAFTSACSSNNGTTDAGDSGTSTDDASRAHDAAPDMQSAPDMATTPDMASASDMATTPDMASASDMATTPDMASTSDMSAPAPCIASAPANGTVNARTTDVSVESGDSPTYACNVGYTITSGSTTCVDGVLTGTVPSCTLNPLLMTTGSGFTCAIRASDDTVWCWGANAHGELGDGTTIESHTPVQVVLNGSGTALRAKSVSAGAGATCAVGLDTHVYCWGNNNRSIVSEDQLTTWLGAVELIDSASDAVSNVVQVAVGNQHACVLLLDGAVTCWGSNGNGQLGTGDVTAARAGTRVQMSLTCSDTPSALPPIAQIIVGAANSCARTASGDVYCWGTDFSGQLGDAEVHAYCPYALPVTLPDGGRAATLASYGGGDSICAITTDAKLLCWGANGNDQFAMHSATGHVDVPTYVQDGSSPLTHVISVALGTRFMCVSTSTPSAVRCAGNDRKGQLGNGATGDSTSLTYVAGDDALLEGMPALYAGAEFACAVSASNDVYCWGDNGNGELGGEPSAFVPYAFDTGLSASAYAVGVSALYMLNVDHTASAIGSQYAGLLGNGVDSTRPTLVPQLILTSSVALTDIASFGTGPGGACVVSSDGDLFCWGVNDSGQLGEGTTTASTTAVEVSATGLGGAMQVTLGQAHTCAIFDETQRFAFCWGDNAHGQLGTSDTTTYTTPHAANDVLGAQLEDVYQLAAGATSTCAALNDGSVWCWGDGSNGRLGQNDSTHTDSNYAVRVVDADAEGIDARHIASTNQTSCAHTTDDEVVCWGYGQSGELGNGATDDSDFAVAVRTADHVLDDVVNLDGAEGGSHFCAVTADTTVWCWGDTVGVYATQVLLADGTPLTGAQDVSVGSDSSCARTADDALVCWGGNDSFQLNASYYIQTAVVRTPF